MLTFSLTNYLEILLGELDTIVAESVDETKNPFLALEIQNNISHFGKFQTEYKKLSQAHSHLTKMECLSFSQLFVSRMYPEISVNFGTKALDLLSYIDASIMATIVGNEVLLIQFHTVTKY